MKSPMGNIRLEISKRGSFSSDSDCVCVSGVSDSRRSAGMALASAIAGFAAGPADRWGGRLAYPHRGLAGF